MLLYFVQDDYANQRKVYGEIYSGTTWLPDNKKHHVDTYTSYYNIYYFSSKEKSDAFEKFLRQEYEGNCNKEKKDLKNAIKSWLKNYKK